MRAIISVPLAILFVFLAGFNAWIMLTRRGASPRSRRLWTQAHRICGYSFIALFVTFVYFMMMRVRGSAEEFSPRLILHMGLALALAPLLFIKVMVVRYQKAAWPVLIALGTAIFIMAFSLVALNVSVHYLRLAERHKLPVTTSMAIVGVAIVLLTITLFVKSDRHPSNADSVTDVPAKISGKNLSGT